MRRVVAGIIGLILVGCQGTPEITDRPVSEEKVWVDLSTRETPMPLMTKPWTEIVVGVPNFEDAPKLFAEIGGFTERFRDQDTLVLGAPGVDGGVIRFKLTDTDAIATRPFGSRSWDTGCYFSIMMRAKNLPSIIDDAKALGWEPLTEMAYLEFGPSKLNIVVLGHKKTGIQVQLYERLTTPLPHGFPEFERLSRPFNMMQMVRDRDVAYDFYQQKLGFETFYYGKPSLSPVPEVMPLGIPVELTTTVPYQAGIMTPKIGLEWGRMEMIEVMMDGGKDLSERCQLGNIGITEVRFEVDNLMAVRAALNARGVQILSPELKSGMRGSPPEGVHVKTPDGANIRIFAASVGR